MRVDGGGGQVQLFGDLLVGQAGRDQLGDPLLAGGQGAGSRSPQTRPSLSVLHHLVRRQLKPRGTFEPGGYPQSGAPGVLGRWR